MSDLLQKAKRIPGDLIYLLTGGLVGSPSGTDHLVALFAIVIIIVIFIQAFGLGLGLRRNMDDPNFINTSVNSSVGTNALWQSRQAATAQQYVGGLQGFRGMRNLAGGSPAPSGVINGAAASVSPGSVLNLAMGN